jgi:hypothetical protein
MLGELPSGRQLTLRGLFNKMKKSFPIGNWFPAPIRASVFEGSVESSKDQSNVATDLFAFKVVRNTEGTVSVTTGTVNTVTATGLEPADQPDELWLKVTFDTDGVVTAASVEESSGTTSETEDYRQIASITWIQNVPTIVQGIKGSQSIASCGATHQWGTLYS